jgi:hypothetical protein
MAIEDPQGLRMHAMSLSGRIILTAAGIGSWGAGALAAIQNKNVTCAAALILVGAVCAAVGLMGRWPSKISMSGNELSWEDVKVTVDSQISNAKASGEAESVLLELTNLRERLDVLQRTGSVPMHPAQLYDEAVEAALRRVLPEAEIIKDEGISRASADFIIWYNANQVYVETKWRSNILRPFAGSTLPDLLETLPYGSKLIVIINTSIEPSKGAYNLMREAIGDGGRIVTWRSIRDDQALGSALLSLTGASTADE